MIKTRDPYSGDPKLFLTPNGMNLKFNNGQPTMDQGFENFTIISLFTAPNYWGNTLKKGGLKYGSTFYKRTMIDKEPITLANLKAWEKAAEKDLKYSPFGQINVTITNPESNKIKLVALISPPTGDLFELIFLKNGQNWINQARDGSIEDPGLPIVKPGVLSQNIYFAGNGDVYVSGDDEIYVSEEYILGGSL